MMPHVKEMVRGFLTVGRYFWHSKRYNYPKEFASIVQFLIFSEGILSFYGHEYQRERKVWLQYTMWSPHGAPWSAFENNATFHGESRKKPSSGRHSRPRFRKSVLGQLREMKYLHTSKLGPTTHVKHFIKGRTYSKKHCCIGIRLGYLAHKS